MAKPTARAPLPSFDPRELMALHINRNHDALSVCFLTIWQHFVDNTYGALGAGDRPVVNTFVQLFLNLFVQPDYVLSDAVVDRFIRLNTAISNVVAFSSTKTTDAHVEVLLDQPQNFIKLLTLCSARNLVQLDRRALFDMDPEKASLWYSAYSEIYRTGLIRPDVCANLREHFRFRHPGLKPAYQCQEIYFGSTYVGGDVDHNIKPVVNETVREQIHRSLTGRPVNRPDPRKIAIVSGLWYPAHPVYRGCSHYIKELKGYHLTFLRLDGPKRGEDLSMFDEVRDLNEVNDQLDVAPVMRNDFQLVYFPDVGMYQASILLANLRFAPIQVAGLTHPVSTFGATLDYMISGADVEDPDHPERNYSERLVLIPGSGLGHTFPPYTPSGRRKSVAEFLINCPCTAQKINHAWCRTLGEMIRRSSKKLRFRFFVGGSLNRQNDFLPFSNDLKASLGPGHVELVQELPYGQYMSLMEEGDISLEAYHFGGGNTVLDSLFVRRPMVTYQGDKFYNRLGSQAMRLAGFPELIATSEEQYLDIALRLIHDDAYRADLTGRLQRADLENSLLSAADARYFRTAIDYLIANHDRLQRDGSRSAVRIER